MSNRWQIIEKVNCFASTTYYNVDVSIIYNDVFISCILLVVAAPLCAPLPLRERYLYI